MLVGILYVIAAVVHTARTDISARTLQLVRSLLHLLPVLGIQPSGNLVDAGVEGHDLESLQHGDEQRALTAEVFDGSLEVNRLCGVQVDETHKCLLLWRVLLWLHLSICLFAIIHNNNNNSTTKLYFNISIN